MEEIQQPVKQVLDGARWYGEARGKTGVCYGPPAGISLIFPFTLPSAGFMLPFALSENNARPCCRRFSDLSITPFRTIVSSTYCCDRSVFSQRKRFSDVTIGETL